MYTIEVMKPEDFAAVYDLWLSVKGMGLNNLDDTEEGFAAFLRRNPSTCFKASEDGVMCGVIMAGHDGRRGYIYHTAVREECRGRGIGRALVEAVKEALIREGIKKTALVVFKTNESGNAFWEKLGFHERDDIAYRDYVLSDMVKYNT